MIHQEWNPNHATSGNLYLQSNRSGSVPGVLLWKIWQVNSRTESSILMTLKHLRDIKCLTQVTYTYSDISIYTNWPFGPALTIAIDVSVRSMLCRSRCTGEFNIWGPSGNVVRRHTWPFQMANALTQLLFEIYEEMSNLHR